MAQAEILRETLNRKKVIILIGLPGAGKTTWAKNHLLKNSNFVRVSRDDFRLQLRNQHMTEPHIEKLIDVLCKETIIQSLKFGQSVIYDNTNLKVDRIEEICSLVEYRADVEFMIFDSSLKKCLAVNDTREDKTLPPHTIIAMNEHFKVLKDSFSLNTRKKKSVGQQMFIQPDFSSSLPQCVISDLDGTIAILRNREPHDWNKVHKDDLNLLLDESLTFHKKMGREIIIVSGRDAVCYNDTKDWLDFYNVSYDKILLREKGDTRRDAIVKRELYEKNILGNYNVICVYDDRLDVVKMWHDQGLFVYTVNQGLTEF